MLFLIMGIVFLGLGVFFYVGGGILAIISYTFLPLGAVFTLLGLFFMKSGARTKDLMTNGLPGTATITGVQQTNTTVNNSPVVKLSLDVVPEGRSPFSTTIRSAVPIVTLSQVKLVPGTVLPVKVDPAKPSSFIIDWNAAIMQAATPAMA